MTSISHPDDKKELAAFRAIQTFGEGPSSGTVIRIPLRSSHLASPDLSFSDKPTFPYEVEQLMVDFIDGELCEVLLFLTHVVSVELYIVKPDGSTVAAKACKKLAFEHSARNTQYRLTISKDGTSRGRNWLLASFSNTEAEVEAELGRRIQDNQSDGQYIDVNAALRKEKLRPDVCFAFPLDDAPINGRLFCFLPLPIFTAFPCHIHALFALGPERQNLLNPSDKALMRQSRRRQVIPLILQGYAEQISPVVSVSNSSGIRYFLTFLSHVHGRRHSLV
jgi:hypothetical protein